MKRLIIAVTIITIVTMAAAGCVEDNSSTGSSPTPTVSTMPATESPQSPAPDNSSPEIVAEDALAAIEGILQDIYGEVNQSVVNIRVVQKQSISFPEFPNSDDFPFFDFEFKTPEAPREYYNNADGSGFVWDKEGHIVTNNHVVAGAERITVTFHDGTTVNGEVIGTDPDSDLAVIEVEISPDYLKPVRVADSTKVKVGQLAVSIGNPFGLEGSMTVGFVSALGRLLSVESESNQNSGYSIPDVIQTDATINPGNSGGVLVNSSGEVIGVPSAIISPVRASSGIGLAIPSAIVTKVIPALIEKGYYEHPWLGIVGASLNPDLAEEMDLQSGQRGALVVDVLPNSPADEAGLRGSDRQVEIYGVSNRIGGDVIIAIDADTINGIDDVVTFLARATEVGQTVTLTVLRDGEEKKIEVKLAARPALASDRAEKETGKAWLGITGRTVTPQMAEAMDLESDQKGVLIVEIMNDSPADEAGLRGSYKPVTIAGEEILLGGDVIVSVDGEEVADMEGLKAIIGDNDPGQQITLTVIRDGDTIDVNVTLSEQH